MKQFSFYWDKLKQDKGIQFSILFLILFFLNQAFFYRIIVANDATNQSLFKLYYLELNNHNLKIGDTVTFEEPVYKDNEPLKAISRVVAVAGDSIMVKDGDTYISTNQNLNKEKVFLNEKYWYKNVLRPKMDKSKIPNGGEVLYNMDEVKISKNCFFAMGNHREISYDSRVYGEVCFDRLEGIAHTLF